MSCHDDGDGQKDWFSCPDDDDGLEDCGHVLIMMMVGRMEVMS